MSIHEERDIVLDKIHALSLRDQLVSYTLLRQELLNEYQFNLDRSASVIWYLNDCRYIIREGENRERIKLTSKGLNMIEQGGFVQWRINSRTDLEEEIESLQQALSALERQVSAFQIRSQDTHQTLQPEREKDWMIWGSLILSIVTFTLVLFHLLGWMKRYFSFL